MTAITRSGLEDLTVLNEFYSRNRRIEAIIANQEDKADIHTLGLALPYTKWLGGYGIYAHCAPVSNIQILRDRQNGIAEILENKELKDYLDETAEFTMYLRPTEKNPSMLLPPTGLHASHPLIQKTLELMTRDLLFLKEQLLNGSYNDKENQRLVWQLFMKDLYESAGPFYSGAEYVELMKGHGDPVAKAIFSNDGKIKIKEMRFPLWGKLLIEAMGYEENQWNHIVGVYGNDNWHRDDVPSPFIPMDIAFDTKYQGLFLVGPNDAGKTTLLELISSLFHHAQTIGYIPSGHAKIGWLPQSLMYIDRPSEHRYKGGFRSLVRHVLSSIQKKKKPLLLMMEDIFGGVTNNRGVCGFYKRLGSILHVSNSFVIGVSHHPESIKPLIESRLFQVCGIDEDHKAYSNKMIRSESHNQILDEEFARYHAESSNSIREEETEEFYDDED